MYRYDEFDHALVSERIAQFRRQVDRRLKGELDEEQFRLLRLMNGLYLQLHAYMLRINVPYGTLSSRQLRRLAHIARTYDRSFGHFTTRQNLQLNWIRLHQVPDLLAELAEVDMNAMQSSGNCVRNITSDHYAGRIREEIADPRPWCELIRQWSILHPEFSYLPRKFKIAVTASPRDRAAVRVHDIGLHMKRNTSGEIGFEVVVGGGLGRMPFIGKTIREFLPTADLLSYLEAILRVYNLGGRRDNIHRARIKVQVNAVGEEKFRELVEKEWAEIKASPLLAVPEAEVARIHAYFADPSYETLADETSSLAALGQREPAFGRWLATNTVEHRKSGYIIVNVPLKTPGCVPGDATSAQMDAVADLADRYSFGELRISHRQNLVLVDVRQKDIHVLWQELVRLDLAAANTGLITDMIACPGLDYCALANARSISVAQAIATRFADESEAAAIGNLTINISGCMNACGHHHVGHIGILGVEKNGQEFYQLTLGGSSAEDTSLGDRLGPGVAAHEVPDLIGRVVDHYKAVRHKGERFLDTYRRVGMDEFKTAAYGDKTADKKKEIA
ncbi:MAG: nitrite/sulfite reductase [Gammaproteobacteria bacterium]|nr:nitrite/sulfite reductase [Gammaproteobacteria bacterium]